MNKTQLLESKLPGWVAALAALSLLAGCAPVDGNDTEGEEAVGEAVQYENGSNGMPAGSLSSAVLSNAGLSGAALTASALSNSGLAGSGLGVQLMKYIVRCAVPSGTCLDVQTTASDTNVPGECVGGTCHLCGSLGLASNWSAGGISLSDERWVSACVLAHVNLDGVSVPISIRDAVSGHIEAAHAPESTQYNSSEAGFYGNIFRPGSSGQYEKYVCNAGASDVPSGRVCGLDSSGATQCAMTYVGSCAGAAVSVDGQSGGSGQSGACGYVDSLPNGAVGQCHDPQGATWSEVITIYDQRTCGNGLCSGSETKDTCPQDCKAH